VLLSEDSFSNGLKPAYQSVATEAMKGFQRPLEKKRASLGDIMQVVTVFLVVLTNFFKEA
jgi:hypothetical protein